MLIVEDQPYMRRTLRKFLQAAFPERAIHEACSGSRALAQCRDHCPSVVLLDIELPDANGIELTPDIRALLPGAAIIIVSHYASAEYVRRALAAGATAYVTKDAVEDELVPAVRAALARQAPPPRIDGRTE
ncbi:MAG TPA: response regulator transcription factor [Thermomonas sp.]|jgi:two-component system response regulator DesR|nr:response regulator transcription factor [Thermomonas sp.]